MRALLVLWLLMEVGGSQANVASVSSDIERAVAAGDTATLERARRRLLSDIHQGESLPLVRYTLAYVNWRLVYLSSKASGPDRTRLLEEAERQLRANIDAGASDAETLALLGTIYGARIAEGASAMRLGPRAVRAISQAAHRAPDNPRIALLHGIHLLFTPTAFGGGLDGAVAELRRAEHLFAEQPTGHPWPNWGRVDALAWLGQALVKKGDYAGARAAYDRALAIEPRHVWIRSLLAALDAQQHPRGGEAR